MSEPQFVPLQPGEVVLSEPQEVLWRQVHPDFVHEGSITSQAFRPFPKDAGELSVTRSSILTAEDAFRQYAEESGYRSDGSYPIRVDDVDQTGLRGVDDSGRASTNPVPLGHGFVDFRHLSDSQTRKAAAKLRDAALAIGRAYPA
jgi:hypothetical protein